MIASDVYGTLYNADVEAISPGMVIRVSGTNRGVRAQADATAHVYGLVGVNGSGIIGIGGPMRIVGSSIGQHVLCETGLTPAAGQALYVSATVPGRVTNVAPVNAVQIGTVVDSTNYTRNSTVVAAVTVVSNAVTASTSSIEVANLAALATVDASLAVGGTRAYVTTLKSVFRLGPGGSSVAATAVRVTALNKPGYLWFREGMSPEWWNQTTWYITNSVLANDESDGATTLTPISPQEYRRRHFLRWLPGTETGSVTYNVIANLGANDFVQAQWGVGLRGGGQTLNVVGAVTIATTGTVSDAIAVNRTTNQRNTISVAGIGAAANVGRIVRLVTTPTTSAVIVRSLNANTVELSEQAINTTLGSGFADGNAVEVVVEPTIPGYDCTGGASATFTNINVTGNGRVRDQGTSLGFFRTRFTSANQLHFLPGVSGATFIGCAFVGVTVALEGRLSNLWLSAQVNQPTTGLALIGPPAVENTIQSHMSEASTLTIGEDVYLHLSGGGSANVGFFNLAAGQVGIDATNSAHYNGGSMWGSGNHASSLLMRFDNGARYSRPNGVSVFTVSGGVGAAIALGGVLVGVPLTALPHAVGPGQQPCVMAMFTGALLTDETLPSASYMANPGSDLALTNGTPQRFVTSERTPVRLRVTFLSGAAVATTVTLYKNNVATAMQVSIPNNAVSGNKFVDQAHSVLFADGDDFDLRMDCAGGVAGTTRVSAVLEALA